MHSVQRRNNNVFNVAPALYGAQRRRTTANAIEAPDLPSISTSEADAECTPLATILMYQRV